MTDEQANTCQEIIKLDQQAIDFSIERVKSSKKKKFWFIVGHLVWFFGLCIFPAFYRQRYGWAIFSVVCLMALVSYHWIIWNRIIASWRDCKRMFAEHKLFFQAELKKHLQYKERGFE